MSTAEAGATGGSSRWTFEASEAVRYLLEANCDTGETGVVLQPWLVVDQPDRLASDLCREWIAARAKTSG